MAIDFEKRPSANLNKNSAEDGIGVRLDNKTSSLITATLKWRSGVRGGSDLDLFAWVVGAGTQGREGGLKGLIKGKTGDLAEVIYHKNLGALDKPPHAEHGGDSKIPGEESVRLGNLDKIDYAMFGVYQAFGNGAGSLKSFDAHVIVTDTEGNEIRVDLVNDHPNRYWATIAHLDLTNPRGYIVKPIEDYSKSRTEKSPVLYADGHFTLNKGPMYLMK
jgi:uncharacterized protein involved in tellurium resistance